MIYRLFEAVAGPQRVVVLASCAKGMANIESLSLSEYINNWRVVRKKIFTS